MLETSSVLFNYLLNVLILFREDQAIEYSSLKKELEQTTKNCRILSFKLRKTERKAEQLETEKAETEKKFKEVCREPYNYLRKCLKASMRNIFLYVLL